MKYSLRSLMIVVLVVPPLIAIGIPTAIWILRPRVKPAPTPVLITEMEGIVEPGPLEMLELSNGLLPSRDTAQAADDDPAFDHYLGTVPVPSDEIPTSSAPVPNTPKK